MVAVSGSKADWGRGALSTSQYRFDSRQNDKQMPESALNKNNAQPAFTRSNLRNGF
jgi:hypothetical protein